MKKGYLVTALLLLLTTWVMPESATQALSADRHDSLLEGCIGGSSDRLTLTDSAGKVYQLRGYTALLAEHVGQHASIIGIEEHGSTGGTDRAQPAFTVKKVAIIASLCSASR